MKKARYFLSMVLVLLILLPTTVFADIGPKPSVTLELKNMPEMPCYVTLLSSETSTGPYSVSHDPIRKDSWLVEGDTELGMKAWQAFRDYKDPDGFYFIEYFEKCGPDELFDWNYRPPHTFKVLIWLPESGEFLSGDICESYAFDSYFAVSVRNDGLRVKKDYHYGWELISLAARIAGTIVLEMLIALLFRLWNRRVLQGIFLTNLVTQCLLNVLLNLFNYHSGSWAFLFHFIWMELAVMLIEALVYKRMFRKYQAGRENTWLTYAAIANAFSFAAGLALARIIPGIF